MTHFDARVALILAFISGCFFTNTGWFIDLYPDQKYKIFWYTFLAVVCAFSAVILTLNIKPDNEK